MPYHPDITVYSPDGEARLLVEVKGRGPADETWAQRFRHNLLAHVPGYKPTHFMVVLPERLYLWGPDADLDAEPDYEASTRRSMSEYLDHDGSGDLGGRAFEFLVRAWLSDLVSLEPTREEIGPDLEWLFDSGLYETIRGGSVETGVAV